MKLFSSIHSLQQPALRANLLKPQSDQKLLGKFLHNNTIRFLNHPIGYFAIVLTDSLSSVQLSGPPLPNVDFKTKRKSIFSRIV